VTFLEPRAWSLKPQRWDLEGLSFWLGGTLTVVAGMLAVTRRNAVASVMWLVAAFLGMAVLFFGMDAAFIGVIQILVYAGAILVLFLFVIMLLNLTPSALVRIDRPRAKVLGIAAASFFVTMIVMVAVGSRAWHDEGTPAAIARRPGAAVRTSDVLPVADQLFDRHLLPFEVASALLLVAIVGAVALTKRKV
jgi:NADH-quinone oxidoreductase subunit J